MGITFKKRLGLCAFSLLFMGSLVTGKAFADEDPNEKLSEMGVPDELIEEMSEAQKEDIIENADEFLTHKKHVSPMQDEDSDDLGAMEIPENDFSFTISIYSAQDGPNGNTRRIIYSNYEWLNQPLWAGTDPFGIAWDPDKFRPVDGTTFAQHEWRSPQGSGRWNVDNTSAIAYSGASGLGWNANLRSHAIYSTQNRGFGRVTIETTSPNDSGSSQIHTNYTHTWGTGTIGLGFGPLDVSYTGSRSGESRGDFRTFYY